MTKYQKHALLLTLCFSCSTILKPALPAKEAAGAELIEITSITQAQKYVSHVDQKTLIVVDLDDTIFQPTSKAAKHCYLQDNKVQEFQAEVGKYLTARMKVDPTALDLFESQQYRTTFEPVEPQMIEFIKEIQEDSIKVIALTDARPRQLGIINRMDMKRYEHLLSVKLDFSTSFDEQEIELKALKPFKDEYPKYYKGIICSPVKANTKGVTLAAFLGAVAGKPNRVIFFDDNKKNVESVIAEMVKLGISCIGFWYRAAEFKKAPALTVYDYKIMAFQLEHLKQTNELLSDAEVRILMQDDDEAKSPATV